MDSSTLFLLAADAMLLLHVLVVVFNVFGLIFIFIGNFLNWHWIRNPWFRLVHLITISIVVLLSWINSICPLTSVEMALRSKAGGTTYSGTFISHWLETILYYQAPPWVFALCYTIFGILVIVSWVMIRPRRFSKFQGTT
jgi:hypothetical protein